MTAVLFLGLVLCVGMAAGSVESFFDMTKLGVTLQQLTTLAEKLPVNDVVNALNKNLGSDQSQPPITATTPSYITDQGYPVESHYITTEDKYILNVFRICHGKNQQYDKSRIPIILQHGLQCTSDMWVGSGPNTLGFALADAGYDVWLGNFRGNEYSTNSTKFSPLNPIGPFWQFNFDESAKYDAPGYIEHITKVTGHQKMIWIGHSMGTTVALALLSTIPKYNDRLLGFIALAPVSRINYGIPALLQILELRTLLTTLYYTVSTTGVSSNLLPNSIITKLILTRLCPPQNPTLCLLLVDLLLGVETSDNFNKSFVPSAFCQFPGGGSLQQLLHYLQASFIGKFTMMQFNPVMNEIKYGQLTAPRYNMSNIRTPTYFVWADNDALAHPLDVAWMRPQIPSLKATAKVESMTYTHADFMWSYRNPELLHPIVFKFIHDILQNSKP